MIYLCLIVLLGYLSYHFDYLNKKDYRKSWYVICWIIFVLIAGLRYRLGVDTIVYESSFTKLPDLFDYWDFDFDSTRFGRGFLLFTAICKSIIDEFVFFQIIHAIFINSIVFYFFYKYTKHIYFALILYLLFGFFPYNFEVLRESCAMAMLLIAWKYFLANKWIKYYICAIVAFFFHPSGLIIALLPILYLPPFRFFFKIGINLVISLCIMGIVGIYLMNNFFDIIQLLGISIFDEYAELYQDTDYQEDSSLNIIGVVGFAIQNILYPLLFVAIIKHSLKLKKRTTPETIEKERRYDKLEYMFCWYIYISLLTLFIMIFYRFNNYFYPFVILAISDAMFTIFRTKRERIRLSYNFWIAIITPFILLNAYEIFLKKDGKSGERIIRRYYPYESVIFKEKDKQREKLIRYHEQ